MKQDLEVEKKQYSCGVIQNQLSWEEELKTSDYNY